MRRFPPDHTAMGNRDAQFFFWAAPVWTDPADVDMNRDWARRICSSIQPYATGHIYANGLETDSPDQVRAAFSREAYERLVAIKSVYDPTNFFRLNQNIKPVTNRGSGSAI